MVYRDPNDSPTRSGPSEDAPATGRRTSLGRESDGSGSRVASVLAVESGNGDVAVVRASVIGGVAKVSEESGTGGVANAAAVVRSPEPQTAHVADDELLPQREQIMKQT
jgi:hypothetical protein